MARNGDGAGDKSGKKKNSTRAAEAAQPNGNGSPRVASPETVTTVALRARVKGEVFLRLRVLHPAYTAEKIAQLLNEGNGAWDAGDSARYHRIEKGGKVIAEIEYADEDTRWERYRAD
jgi:hypothetical protein